MTHYLPIPMTKINEDLGIACGWGEKVGGIFRYFESRTKKRATREAKEKGIETDDEEDVKDGGTDDRTEPNVLKKARLGVECRGNPTRTLRRYA